MLSTSMELAQGQGPPQEKVADIQAAATVDWSPLGEIFVKYAALPLWMPLILVLYISVAKGLSNTVYAPDPIVLYLSVAKG